MAMSTIEALRLAVESWFTTIVPGFAFTSVSATPDDADPAGIPDNPLPQIDCEILTESMINGKPEVLSLDANGRALYRIGWNDADLRAVWLFDDSDERDAFHAGFNIRFLLSANATAGLDRVVRLDMDVDGHQTIAKLEWTGVTEFATAGDAKLRSLYLIGKRFTLRYPDIAKQPDDTDPLGALYIVVTVNGELLIKMQPPSPLAP